VAEIQLAPGETFVSESGAMVRASAGVDIDVTAKPKGSGGVFGSFKRLLGGDSFFMSTYTAEAGPGEVVLAPVMPGEVHAIELDGTRKWMCAGGSYVASGPDVLLDTKFQGFRGFFSGENLFFVEAGGRGPLLVSAFGHVRPVQCEGSLIVDTGHLVAFEESLQYEITKAGTSWITSWLAGEGFVMRFKGRGRVLVQSHNPTEFGRTVGPMLPPR
jgi:uncharacterized protein (TIGR00266 family)